MIFFSHEADKPSRIYGFFFSPSIDFNKHVFIYKQSLCTNIKNNIIKQTLKRKQNQNFSKSSITSSITANPIFYLLDVLDSLPSFNA
jgi:hypothetical protein